MTRISIVLGASALFTFACSREHAAPSAGSSQVTPSVSAPSASVSAAPSASAAAAPPLVVADGAHDYRGTLGDKITIAMHVVRAGSSAQGSYAYARSKSAISLSGSVDAAGTIALTESTNGVVTGSFRLHPDADALVGDWTNAKKTKTFPVRLKKGAVLALLVTDAGALSLAKAAEDCLAEPACTAETAASDFIRADDAHDPDVDCFRFLDGAGVARDLPRARACFARGVDPKSCSTGLLDLGPSEYVNLLIDGIGGPRDLAGAMKIIDSCGADGSASGLREHAEAVKRDPHTPAIDFCKDIGGPTVVSNQCIARSSKNEETKAALNAKTVFKDLDDEGKGLFTKAEAAHAAYVSAVGSYVYQAFVEGTLRGAMSVDREGELQKKRGEELAKFSAFVAPETTAADVAAARAKTKKAIAAIETSSAEEKAALAKSQAAWTTYEDAEIAFYAHVFGPKQGADKVKNAITVRLENRRAGECAPPSLGN